MHSARRPFVELSLNIELPLKKTWQVMLHYHAETGDVKSTYKAFD